jgi:hypothetical protein
MWSKLERYVNTDCLGFNSAVRILITVLLLLTLVSCGGGGGGGTTPEADQTGSGTIGPAGGTASDAGGASVVIPAGALASLTLIEVSSYQDLDSCLKPAGPVPAYLGGAMFGPLGTQFLAPVTVTIPCSRDLNPGSQFPLFIWDETELAWAQSAFVATVAADGKSFSAPVTHFSVFAGFGPVNKGLFGDIDEQLCAGGDPSVVLPDFVDMFEQDIARVGDQGIYQSSCMEVTGIDFDIGIEIERVWASDFIRKGETADESIMFVYTAECGTGTTAGGYIDATVVIYYQCSAPALTVSADPAKVDHLESSTVMATLKCGQLPFPRQTIQFERVGDGDIIPDQSVTNPAGQAQTLYNAPDHDGQATVKAYYDACAGEDNSQTVQSDALISVGDSWTGSMTVEFSHPLPDAPLLEFADLLTINFSFNIDEGVISGTGTGTHEVEITPGDTCELASLSAPPFDFTVTGTATQQTLELAVVPDGLIPLNFVIICHTQSGDLVFPYPPYGAFEGSILSTHVLPSLTRENNATASESGSEDWGEALPMYYSYTVTISDGSQ